MGVVRKVVNYICNTLTPKVEGAIDHLPARFNGTFNDNSRVLTMTIESQGTSTENLIAEVTIPGGGGSGGPTYSAGTGINITSANAIEIDPDVTATKQSVKDCFNNVVYDSATNKITFTALDGQSNALTIDKNWGLENNGKVLEINSDGLATPVDKAGAEWQFIMTTSDIDKSKLKVGSQLILPSIGPSIIFNSCILTITKLTPNSAINFSASGYVKKSAYYYPLVAGIWDYRSNYYLDINYIENYEITSESVSNTDKINGYIKY